MTEPAHPPRIAVKPPWVNLHAHAPAKEPLHRHKRAYHSLGGEPVETPAVENTAEKE